MVKNQHDKSQLGKRARQRRRGQEKAAARRQTAWQACQSFPAAAHERARVAPGAVPIAARTLVTASPHLSASGQRRTILAPMGGLPVKRRPPVAGRVRLALDSALPPAPRKLIVVRPALELPATGLRAPMVDGPAAVVVDLATLRDRRHAARQAARLRTAAALLLAPLAIVGLVLADPFGTRTPQPQKIAVKPQTQPQTEAVAGVHGPVASLPRVQTLPTPEAATVRPPAPALPLADPPDGFLRAPPRTANPTSAIARDWAALESKPAAPAAPAPASSVVALLPPAAATQALPPAALAHDLTALPRVPADAGVPEAGRDSGRGVGHNLVLAAHDLTKIPGGYDPKYLKIAYPMGDVPEGWGVCSDVIVRAFRGVGVDLQHRVHVARLGTGDTNVDHRRVTVLMKFFQKNAQSLTISRYPEAYQPGDIVAYDVPWGRTSKWHIAIVTDQLSPSLRPMVVHNRGYGAKLEDALFHKRIIGHYRLDGAALLALQGKAPPALAAAPAGVTEGKAGEGKVGSRQVARVSSPRS